MRGAGEGKTRNVKAHGQLRAQKQKGVLEQSISYAKTEMKPRKERKRENDAEKQGQQKREREKSSRGTSTDIVQRCETAWHEREETEERRKKEL